MTAVRRLLFSFAVLSAAPAAAQPAVINFADVALPPNTYSIGEDGAGGFTSGRAFFNTDYFPPGGGYGDYFSGWGRSTLPTVRLADAQPDEYGYWYKREYEMAAVLPAPATGPLPPQPTFAVATFGATVVLPPDTRPTAVTVTNTAYTALSFLNGDPFTRTPKEGDHYEVVITGLDAAGKPTGSKAITLGEWAAGAAGPTVLSAWTTVDLTADLKPETVSLSFDYTSTVANSSGPVTPGYVAVRDISVVPEPGLLLLAGGAGLMAWRRYGRRLHSHASR